MLGYSDLYKPFVGKFNTCDISVSAAIRQHYARGFPSGGMPQLWISTVGKSHYGQRYCYGSHVLSAQLLMYMLSISPSDSDDPSRSPLVLPETVRNQISIRFVILRAYKRIPDFC
jgi:hypothetical protein